VIRDDRDDGDDSLFARIEHNLAGFQPQLDVDLLTRRYSCRFSRVAASAGAVKASFLRGSGFRERPDAPHLIFRTYTCL
jgi:hypothetical protein